MANGEPVGCRVLYAGRVQGVGFRATAAGIAAGFPVTGYVRNTDDGRVELLAEGAEADVTAFLRAVRDRWGGFVRDEVQDWRPATGRYSRFTIEH